MVAAARARNGEVGNVDGVTALSITPCCSRISVAHAFKRSNATDLEDYVKTDGSNESTHSALRARRLLTDALGSQMLVVDDQRLGHVTIAQVDDRRSTEESYTV